MLLSSGEYTSIPHVSQREQITIVCVIGLGYRVDILGNSWMDQKHIQHTQLTEMNK